MGGCGGHLCCRENPDTDTSGTPLMRKRRNKNPGGIGFPMLLLLCAAFTGSANSSQKDSAGCIISRHNLGCFIEPSRIRLGRRGSSSWCYTSRSSSLTSTKEECYDTLLNDLGQERRPKSKLSFVRPKVHKRKRNKLLKDHFNAQSNTNSTSYYYETKKKKTKRKQLRRTSKSLSTSTVAQIVTGEGNESLPSRRTMPPWLAWYENEDFVPYNHHEAAEISKASHKSYSDEILAAKKLKHLEQAMSGSFNDGKSTFKTKPLFSPNEILDVLDSIRVASQSNVKLIMGCADFLYLMLTLEEYDDIDMNGIDVPKALIMTREVLVAAAFHYCDCVRARKAGVYDVVKAFMEAGVSESVNYEQSPVKRRNGEKRIDNSVLPQLHGSNERDDKTAIAMTEQKVHITNGKSPIEKYGNETVRIASGAAKLKRAEVMSTTVNAKYLDQDSPGAIARKKSKSMNSEALSSNASILRSFLVSISDDWRALVIRSAACLYRLRGIVEEGNSSIISRSNSRRLVYSTTSMQTARDALRVYAPLAQRMGMQRLKSQIENTAFRILYPRQYDVSSALHDKDLSEMQTIIQVLSSRIEQLLVSDEVFIANVDNVSVSSRVKEPYSLWKKILRYRKEAVIADRGSFMPATLSTKWVPDAIALRVIIRGKQMPMEDEESLRTREKMLCYFALQKIGDVWPASEANVAKDYISSPKPNGYQSLHYTAALLINGEEWPFEVQVCQ